MTRSGSRQALPPLDEDKLNELALRYVSRYATTRAKLRNYLARKIKERGWGGQLLPDFARIADRFAAYGYIDDAAYALATSRALSGRGYGKKRLLQSLRAAGVETSDSIGACNHADLGAVEAALRFAKKRRFGPFAQSPHDPRQRQKALRAMLHAGHGFGLARAILLLAPGAEIDMDQLNEHARVTIA